MEKILETCPDARPGTAASAAKIADQIKAYFARERKDFRMDVDFSWATPFQKKVYSALMKIPYGQTRSYAQVAKMAGKGKAARAAGSANARNRVPLIVPCHRVINADGGLGGFSGPGGVGMKKRLLEHEQGQVNRKYAF
jgi:methylated-DNA-[protein]-cysteine S-methyltransferase